MRMRRIAVLLCAILYVPLAGAAGPAARAVEQGTITVTKTWAAGQEPSEVVEVCFRVTADAAGTEVLGEACTADERYTVTFGPSDPALQTGVTYYVWEEVGQGWEVTGDNPVAVSIPDTTGKVNVNFENRRTGPSGTGTLEIHKRVCPNGPPTTDIFVECHGYPPQQPVAFALDGGQPQFVDETGNVRFTGITAGTHTVTETEGPPLEFVTLRVWCADVSAGEAATEVTPEGPSFTVEVRIGAGVVCDVYNIPQNLSGGTGAIEVHVSACPPGATDQLFELCHANGRAGVEMVLQGPLSRRGTTAGPIGAVRFTELPPGTYTVAEAVPSGEFARYVVYCSDASTHEQVLIEYRGDGRAAVQFDLADGQQVVCDWFDIPAAHALPTPAPSAEIDSGGIGLSRSAWEREHGKGTRAGAVELYENGTYAVAITDGFVTFVERGWEDQGGIAVTDASDAVRALLPADAKLVSTYYLPSTPGGPIGLAVERYESASLAARLEPLALGWDGSIVVVYQETVPTGQQTPTSEEPKITRVSIAAGIKA
jgi:hypothetical protein